MGVPCAAASAHGTGRLGTVGIAPLRALRCRLPCESWPSKTTPNSRAIFAGGLAESGYVVDVATDGIDGRHMAIEGNYDLVLLDVMLPGADGFTLLETLRQHKDTPVIMLTAADSVEDRVRGLRAGADRLSGQTLRLYRAAGTHPGRAAARCCGCAP